MSERKEEEKKDQEERDENKRKVGRGSFVSFIGKNTAVKIIQVIADEIRSQMALDIKSAGKFSLIDGHYNRYFNC